MMLKMPIIGPLLRKIAVARFTRTMATLIASGVPILDCLEITAKTSGNAIVEEAIFKVKRSIEEGRTIVEPLKESKVFPAMVVQMVGVGEQAGALEQMLTKIADFYEEEVDCRRRRSDDGDGAGNDRCARYGGGRHRYLHVPANLYARCHNCPELSDPIRTRGRRSAERG